MASLDSKILLECTKLVVKPLVAFCLRHSLKIQDLMECIKVVYVEQARKQIEQLEQEVTTSRIAIMTGLHRRDVTRVSEERIKTENPGGLITQIVGQWRRDKRFSKRGKDPRTLSCGTSDSEFNQLVKIVSSDLNPATVLFELERVGAVKRNDDQVALCMESYIPKGDVLGGFQILSEDMETLTASVEENMIDQPTVPNHHLHTFYDKVREDAVPEIREWLLREGHAFQMKVRDHLSKFDQDVNPDREYKGRFFKVVFGSFSKVFGR